MTYCQHSNVVVMNAEQCCL